MVTGFVRCKECNYPEPYIKPYSEQVPLQNRKTETRAPSGFNKLSKKECKSLGMRSKIWASVTYKVKKDKKLKKRQGYKNTSKMKMKNLLDFSFFKETLVT